MFCSLIWFIINTQFSPLLHHLLMWLEHQSRPNNTPSFYKFSFFWISECLSVISRCWACNKLQQWRRAKIARHKNLWKTIFLQNPTSTTQTQGIVSDSGDFFFVPLSLNFLFLRIYSRKLGYNFIACLFVALVILNPLTCWSFYAPPLQVSLIFPDWIFVWFHFSVCLAVCPYFLLLGYQKIPFL